nr:MAG TPA: hypothetical protein [Caudoviricetes sp.]
MLLLARFVIITPINANPPTIKDEIIPSIFKYTFLYCDKLLPV